MIVDRIEVVHYKERSIYIDDEGLLKDNPHLTLLLNDTNQYLYGNVLIMGNVDEEGETLGITLKNVDSLISQLRVVIDMVSNKSYFYGR